VPGIRVHICTVTSFRRDALDTKYAMPRLSKGHRALAKILLGKRAYVNSVEGPCNFSRVLKSIDPQKLDCKSNTPRDTEL